MKRNLLGLFEFLNIYFIFSSVLVFSSVIHEDLRKFSRLQASIVSKPLEKPPSPPFPPFSFRPFEPCLAGNGELKGIRTGSVQSFQRNTSALSLNMEMPRVNNLLSRANG